MLKHYQNNGLRLGTRGSPLALWQAQYAATTIKNTLGIDCTIVKIKTYADTHQASLQNINQTGVFVSAIQQELVRGTIDAAVHSLKDLPVAGDPLIANVLEEQQLQEQQKHKSEPHSEAYAPKSAHVQQTANDGKLHTQTCEFTPAKIQQTDEPTPTIAAFLPLGDRTDLLCTYSRHNLVNLPHGAKIATGSIRRKMQLLHMRPDLDVVDIRGNVGTRLAAVQKQGLDGVVLARAGLARLDIIAQVAQGEGAANAQAKRKTATLLEEISAPLHLHGFDLVAHELPLHAFPTAAGQGCVVIETLGMPVRNSLASTQAANIPGCHQTLYNILQKVNHPRTHLLMLAERGVLQLLGCGCTAPVAVSANWVDNGICLQAWVYKKHGGFVFARSHAAITPLPSAEELGLGSDQGFDSIPCKAYASIRSAIREVVHALGAQKAKKYIDEYR